MTATSPSFHSSPPRRSRAEQSRTRPGEWIPGARWRRASDLAASLRQVVLRMNRTQSPPEPVHLHELDHTHGLTLTIVIPPWRT